MLLKENKITIFMLVQGRGIVIVYFSICPFNHYFAKLIKMHNRLNFSCLVRIARKLSACFIDRAGQERGEE